MTTGNRYSSVLSHVVLCGIQHQNVVGKVLYTDRELYTEPFHYYDNRQQVLQCPELCSTVWLTALDSGGEGTVHRQRIGHCAFPL